VTSLRREAVILNPQYEIVAAPAGDSKNRRTSNRQYPPGDWRTDGSLTPGMTPVGRRPVYLVERKVRWRTRREVNP